LRLQLDSWQLNAFDLAELCGGRPLSILGTFLFEHLELNDHFGLDRSRVQQFFRYIEDGYDPAVAYHNSVHAVSVMYYMYVILHHGGVAQAVACAMCSDGEQRDASGKFELLVGLVAAAAHDFEHTGLNNDFLVKTRSEKALRYSNKNVNENHHCESAWAVLQQDECNFLNVLSPADLTRFRRLLSDLIVGTDLAEQDRISRGFTTVLDAAITPGPGLTDTFRPRTEEEATLFLQTALKAADLGHLVSTWDVHVRWVQLLEEEFFLQGDLEKDLGLPVSFLMDRGREGASATTPGFFEYFAKPVFSALACAAPLTKPMLEKATNNMRRWLAEAEELVIEI
jgi:cAMP-specific phosphodiesterase 4/calcium/calmodulin-dependent 3',5'-cyclic nucleotide phosphodiesterase